MNKLDGSLKTDDQLMSVLKFLFVDIFTSSYKIQKTKSSRHIGIYFEVILIGFLACLINQEKTKWKRNTCEYDHCK